MAIGDSLAQGCRHLTVNASYCAQSWPARVAQAQAWDFASPDHPREVLFNLEEEIRRVDPVILSPATLAFAGLPSRIRANFRAWQQQPGGSKYECFDNLGIAGAAVHQLYSLTSESCAKTIAELTPGGPSDVMGNIGALHLPINGRFVLNPQQKSAYMTYSPLDWVERREPENLVVHIGHNHGLFAFGFSAKDQASITQGEHDGRDYWEQWQVVAERLAALPPSVKNILIVTLPKVGAVAALRPISQQRQNGYAPAYEPRLLPVRRSLQGRRVAEIDAMIRAVNGRIEKLVRQAAAAAGSEARLAFFDAYDALDALDFKNSLDPKQRLRMPNKLLIDNRYLDGKPGFPEIFKGSLVQGGFFSVDGMHASGVGYADLASRAMVTLGLPHSAKERERLLDRAFAEDPMLSRYPLELDAVVRMIDIARTLSRANYLVPEAENRLDDKTHLAIALPMLASAYT